MEKYLTPAPSLRSGPSVHNHFKYATAQRGSAGTRGCGDGALGTAAGAATEGGVRASKIRPPL